MLVRIAMGGMENGVIELDISKLVIMEVEVNCDRHGLVNLMIRIPAHLGNRDSSSVSMSLWLFYYPTRTPVSS